MAQGLVWTTIPALKPPIKKGTFFGGVGGGVVLGSLAARTAERGGCSLSREAVTDEDGYVIGYRCVRYCD